MKKRVLLRADGNQDIGMGHVIRSIALGSMLTNSFDCFLYTRFTSNYIEKECKLSGIELQEIGAENHFAEFLKYLDGSEIVVLDNYFFSTDHQIEIKEKGSKLVCIDDLHEIDFVADLVINHSPAAQKSDYKTSEKSKLLLGLDFVLLRRPFLEYAKNKSPSQGRFHNVLLCFGGADINNLSGKYTQELLRNTEFRITVVIGSSFTFKEEMKMLGEEERVSVYQGLSQSEMIEVIQNVDCAIVPSSSILFEVIAMRKPFVTGFFVENQKEISLFFKEKNEKISIGDFRLDTSLAKSLSFENYPYNLLETIDGRSSERIIYEFKAL